MNHIANYSQIIAPELYNRIITEEHLYIAESDQIIKELIEREVWERGATEIVDLGCGPARMLSLTAQIPGINLTGVDHDKAFLDYARKVVRTTDLNVKLVLDNAEDYQHSKPVDVFYSQGFHHHVERDGMLEEYLQNVYIQLREGGAYIVGDEFLPEYSNEEERQIRAVIWYAHIISNALSSGYFELAVEEAKTLLDDLAEGTEGETIKSSEQIDLLLDRVHTINEAATGGSLNQAEAMATRLLRSLHAFQSTRLYGDPSIDLSRGDYKICDSGFQKDVEDVGFEVESSKAIGPIQSVGAMVVYILRK